MIASSYFFQEKVLLLELFFTMYYILSGGHVGRIHMDFAVRRW